MHPTAAEFVRRAREAHGADLDVREFGTGTRTAAEAAEAIGCAVGRIASSLVFRVDDDLAVVVTSGAGRASEARVAAAFDADPDAVTLADPDAVREATGWAIGGVPPFCHERDLPVLLDEALTRYGTVWAAAGTPEAVFEIDPEELRRYAGATVADVADGTDGG